MENVTFKSLGLNDKVLNSIEKLGYSIPSPIQVQIIPEIMNGNDVIGQAQTGTGKTLAFAASILSLIDEKEKGIKSIILTPTRELALQVCEEFVTLNKSKDFEILPVYGGSSIDIQIRSLKKGTDIVVGTPGRVMDLINRGVLKLEKLKFFVLDEADEMLNMGFLEDIEFIFNKTNKEKQVLLFSATMPNGIKKLAEKYMKLDYQHIKIEADTKTATNVKQYYYLVNERQRNESLCRILDDRDPDSAIIFCQTKRDVDQLTADMAKRNYSVEAIHGDITQSMRIKRLERFKNKEYKFLIATDVAARGIHVDNITCVINYNLPQEIESYIHRIGRTGRAEKEGYAITLVNHREIRMLSEIERFTNSKIMQSELPNNDDIINKRYEKIITKVNETISNKEYEPYIKYVRDMNKEDLTKFSAGLIKHMFDKEIGSDFSKDINVVEKAHKNYDKNATRVFLTIGKMDDLKAGTLLDFMKKETGIDKDHFSSIEILTKFTFLNVANDHVDDFIKKIYNKRLNGRVVRAEKARGK
jgi:ATP-dependent RNA helicase DeaD